MNPQSNVIAYVVGDYMVDRWQEVSANRIAPDAPVPVWDAKGGPIVRAGGAGNVAHQFKFLASDIALGAYHPSPGYASACEGFRLFTRNGGDQRIKTRYVSRGHVLARFDNDPLLAEPEARRGFSLAIITDIASELQRFGVKSGRAMNGKSVVAVLSDYAGGFWTPSVATAAIDMFRSFGVLTVVDPKPRGIELAAWAGANIIKVNESEARAFGACDDPNSAAIRMNSLTGAKIVITRGRLAPVIFERDAPEVCGTDMPDRSPIWASGAGDCFAAHLAALHGKGFGFKSAVIRAHQSAAVYVLKTYNTPIHPGEAAELADPDNKEYDCTAELSQRIAALPPGSKIGYANGCFDLLHAGHIRTLQFAKACCDFLVVFLNSDESVRANKGHLPVLDSYDRTAALCALACVDAVTIFDEPTPAPAFARVGRCDVLVKGSEYEGKPLEGGEYATRFAFAPMGNDRGDLHTSEIIRRCKAR